MKLTDWMIKLFIWFGWLKISPYDSKLVNPNSIDIRLGNTFGFVSPTKPKGLIDPLDPTTFKTQKFKSNYFILIPGASIIGCLQEDVKLSRFICSEIRGKSSLGRLFLDNSSVAGWVDAGWEGVLTIEITNNGSHPIKLTPGMKIGQMVFNLTLPCWKSYGERSTSKYQNQEPGTGSKGI